MGLFSPLEDFLHSVAKHVEQVPGAAFRDASEIVRQAPHMAKDLGEQALHMSPAYELAHGRLPSFGPVSAQNAFSAIHERDPGPLRRDPAVAMVEGSARAGAQIARHPLRHPLYTALALSPATSRYGKDLLGDLAYNRGNPFETARFRRAVRNPNPPHTVSFPRELLGDNHMTYEEMGAHDAMNRPLYDPRVESEFGSYEYDAEFGKAPVPKVPWKMPEPLPGGQLGAEHTNPIWAGMSAHPAYRGQVADLTAGLAPGTPIEAQAEALRRLMMREHGNIEFGQQTFNDYLDAGMGATDWTRIPKWMGRAESEHEWKNMGSPFPEGPVGPDMPGGPPPPGMYGMYPITRWEMMDDAVRGTLPGNSGEFLKAYLRRMRLPGGGY